jgi:anti-sigma factor RsiW
MTDSDAQLELQAYFDGELPQNDARVVAGRLARDSEGAALLTELRNTRQALKDFESDIRLPESREFFWSKVERAIGRLEESQPVAREPEPLLARWRRHLVPAGAFAVLLLLVVVAAKQWDLPMGLRVRARQSPAVETALADTGAFTYRDQTAGITVVWLSYPNENELADANSFDTIQ